MLILFQWIFAHLLGDFIFQSRAMVRHKKRLKAASGILYLHCLLHGILVYLFTQQWQLWQIPLIVIISHFIIDLWKLYRPDKLLYFILDQLLHVLVLVALWFWYFVSHDNWIPYLEQWLQSRGFWTIGTGYLLVSFPLSILLAYATQRWRIEAEQSGLRSTISLSEAGKWIGILERLLVYTFVITGHFEGIGFLIAAKSILRFNDIKGSEARKEAEYVLIGTLMSFSASILVGLIVRQVV